jgi:hypothetical protein
MASITRQSASFWFQFADFDSASRRVRLSGVLILSVTRLEMRRLAQAGMPRAIQSACQSIIARAAPRGGRAASAPRESTSQAGRLAPVSAFLAESLANSRPASALSAPRGALHVDREAGLVQRASKRQTPARWRRPARAR